MGNCASSRRNRLQVEEACSLLTSDLAASRNELAVAQNDLASSRQELCASKTREVAFRFRVAVLRTRLHRLRLQYASLQETHQQQSSHLAQKTAENLAQRENIEARLQELNLAQTRSEQLSTDAVEITESLRMLEQDNLVLTRDKIDAQSSCSRLEAANVSAQNTNAHLRADLERLERSICALQEKGTEKDAQRDKELAATKASANQELADARKASQSTIGQHEERIRALEADGLMEMTRRVLCESKLTKTESELQSARAQRCSCMDEAESGGAWSSGDESYVDYWKNARETGLVDTISRTLHGSEIMTILCSGKAPAELDKKAMVGFIQSFLFQPGSDVLKPWFIHDNWDLRVETQLLRVVHLLNDCFGSHCRTYERVSLQNAAHQAYGVKRALNTLQLRGRPQEVVNVFAAVLSCRSGKDCLESLEASGMPLENEDWHLMQQGCSDKMRLWSYR